MFDAAAKNPYTKIGIDAMNNAAGQALALQAAREAIVLLKNEKNILPLRLASLSNVAVIWAAIDAELNPAFPIDPFSKLPII